MDPQLNEIQRIACELRSDKAPARNKAIEQLDQKLNSFKSALNAVLGRNEELSWQNLLVIVKEAILKHANNLRDATSEKARKQLADKCYLYGNVMDRIIDYNLEMGRASSGHFLTKSTIFDAFVDGTKSDIVVRYFGVNFVNLLDRGIYLSSRYTLELKVSEYSNILSVLFELNIDDDEFLRSKILKCITKTVEIAQERTQLHDDLVEYLPTLISYTQTAHNAERIKDVVRLYYLFVGELSVNYHHTLCIHMQNIIPKLCDFYNEDKFCDDTKKLFFECVILSLQALYPKLKSNDFSTFQVPIRDDWPQSMQKLHTIIKMEIRKHTMGRNKPSVLNTDKFPLIFIKLSALVTYIVLWHVEPNQNKDADANTSKRQKVDIMTSIINLINMQKTSFSAVWFAIFAELLQLSSSIISEGNYYQEMRETTLHVLQIYGNAYNLRNVRLCLASMLAKEQEQKLSKSHTIVSDFYAQVATHLISETRPAAEEIIEKQIILQSLIKYDKLSAKLCTTLLQSITTNEMLRRNECIATIRVIFTHAEQCGIDKATAVVEPLIRWAYDHEKSIATQIINNIAAIDQKLLADTFAIGIINFLDEDQVQQLATSNNNNSPIATEKAEFTQLQLLLYKYNKQLVCLDDPFQSRLRGPITAHSETPASVKSCLYVHNYELLMRMLDPAITNESSTSSLIKDLKNLHKLVCTMERLLHYNVFDVSNFMQCPLMKRIGFFLSHTEIQYTSIQPDINRIDESDFHEILDEQIAILEVFNSNEILLEYLEKQPMEMLLEFIGVLLKHSYTRKDHTKSTDRTALNTKCVCILGSMCANSTYSTDAISHLVKNLMERSPLNDEMMIIKMLCRCKGLSEECLEWLACKLKNIFQHHNTNVDIMSQVVEEIPTLTHFFYDIEHLLDVIMIALMSLLKIALKKSYPTQLAVQIVRSVGQIAQSCPNIYNSENFLVICQSVANFLAMPTLEVRYATIETLTILLNSNYCVSNSDADTTSKHNRHLIFCDQLYGSIDFKDLSFTGKDMLLNNHSVAIQSLSAFFAFSAFHQERSLQDLMSYCATHKLNANDFSALGSLVQCHKLTMCELMTPYSDTMLQKWISLRRSVSKFPYYLGYDTKEAFLKANCKNIMAYSFIYRTPEDINRFKTLLSEREAAPILMAYMVSEWSDCIETQNEDFRQHLENLKHNIQLFGMHPLDVALNVESLYETIRHLHDEDEWIRLFGESAPYNKLRMWFHLSASSLFKSLNQHISGKRWSRDERIQAMSLLMFEHRLLLVDLLGILKTACHLAMLADQVLHNFFSYCTIADAILDAAMERSSSNIKTDADLIQVNCAYFVSDIWHFFCGFLLHSKCGQLHRVALLYIQSRLNICTFQSHNINTIDFDKIGKLLIASMQHVKTVELKLLAADVLKKFLNIFKLQLNEDGADKAANLQTLRDLCEMTLNVQTLLVDEDSEGTHLQSLRDLCEMTVPRFEQLSVVDYMRTFLKSNRMEPLHGLREYIAEHKDELQSHQQLLFELINRLIHMVRESPSKKGSIDAVKSLAEIGPLKLKRNSYYFQTEFEDIQQLQSSEQPIVQFLDVIMETLEKQLYDFNTSTQKALIQVAGHVVDSKDGSKLVSDHPHLRIFKTSPNNLGFLNTSDSIPVIDWLTVLKSSEQLDYRPWLCTFMGLVFGECGWQGFDAFAAKSFTFAKACLQPFIKLLLSNKEQHLDSLCSMLEHFFESAASEAKGVYQDKRVIKQFLYICECIRLVNNWSIPINLENVVKASNHCQAYFLSIMYLELWAYSANATADANILADESFQLSAKIAYTSIGCLDAIPGFLDPLRSRSDYFSLNDNLSGILLESDNLDEPTRQMCIDIMKSNGMLSLADLYQRVAVDGTTRVDYEVLWRLCDWDAPIDGHQKVNRANNMELEFNKHHYLALKSISKREKETTVTAINNAYQCVQAILRDISVECLQSVYKYMTWLCMLQQTEDFWQIQFSQQLSPAQKNVFNKWRTELNLAYGNFRCKEQILAHQITLFKMPGMRADRRIKEHYLQNPVDTYLLKCIGECKAAGKLNLATKYIATLRALPDIKMPTQLSALLEDAEVNMKTCNYQIAKAILHHVNTNSDFKYCVERVTALRMQGEFQLDCNADNFANTLRQTFNTSLQLLDYFKAHKVQLMKLDSNLIVWDKFEQFEIDNRMAAHASIAKYADREYQQLYDYRQSQEYKTLVDIIQQNRRLAGTVTASRQREDRDRQLGALNLKRFANLDAQELNRIENNLTEHLCTAITHYIEYCQLDKGFSSAEIYRIIALWFTNDQNEQMLNTIKDAIQLVPSYKFICVVSQLAGRLNSKHAPFHKILVDLLVRCGQDHPQQTFYKLYPLVYAYLDGEYANTQRADIAKKIIARSCEANTAALEASKQFELMFPALIKFANSYIGPNGKPNNEMMPAMIVELNKLKLDRVQCPTIELVVQPSKEYNIISIVKWTGKYEFCGGLNAPVKLMCLCSDGVVRAQLIKGKDDLRQDAVMQQVFGIVNELFNSDSEFAERKLQLRTYKVTPLSMRCGIIEWVSNTIPIGTYLAGNGTGGAHMKYRPTDWNNNKCRQMAAAALKKTPDVRRSVYKKICEKVQPVFHYFLLEKFPIPGEWFERRLAYINSVATTSMVGYVLGLGDRHTQNILIDAQTAEVVHIDFGIAFEQGKIQNTPETVPFRLTRDMVAPMGVCGTNGVFTKSCEATMHILRRYKSVLITILEVLLYDPLFIWGVLSTEQQQQMSNEESKNILAQRALLLVKHKLEGGVPGLLENSDVKTQVQRLINEAKLPSNLAMLYHGWDPYM
ncbi:serine/threonine-protein kinase ATM [Drosophila grimshawi]|uniref:serine/threonine-protein kinase ATM n=1 Tax=Drosophila grimshawi TaxID=7222 RepID=UPI001C934AA5|nr:serine/threonine-protein kinase ATM [Drosophila grimshawi]